jgi:hypothetical protein
MADVAVAARSHLICPCGSACAPNYRPRNALLCVKNNKFRLVTDREIDRSGDKTDVMDLLMNGRGGVEIGSW